MLVIGLFVLFVILYLNWDNVCLFWLIIIFCFCVVIVKVFCIEYEVWFFFILFFLGVVIVKEILKINVDKVI